jgi:hypothetical protein
LNTFTFFVRPDQRLRSFTSMDAKGKSYLDKLYTNPVFCVRYKGIRQGNTTFSAIGPTGVHWPLQLHTFFKMRTYTKFDRLMGVYAQRSYLPLPWLDFQITDRFYKREVKKPILKQGDKIRQSHSLWTIGLEPRLETDPEDEPTDEDPDIWVDSYLTCAEDECFVYVRDARRIANIKPLKLSWPKRCEKGADEGALLGDGSLSGPLGNCGRFVMGDSASHVSTVANVEEPGQPLRPRFPGWMFKVKQSTPLQPIMDRVSAEVKSQLYESETVDNSTPVAFRCVIVSNSLGNERFGQEVVDGADSPVVATAKVVMYGSTVTTDTLPPSASLPLHILELQDLIEEASSSAQEVEEDEDIMQLFEDEEEEEEEEED